MNNLTGRLTNEKGIAFFIVLWVLVLLSVIVGQFCYSMRAEVNMTRTLKERTQAFYIAEAGFNRAVAELLNPAPEPEESETEEVEETEVVRWRVNADIPEIGFKNGSYKVSIGNESGKININTADKKLLALLFNGFALEEDEVNVIIDSIQDWRDGDDFIRLSGAENDYYQSLESPYESKNADFSSIEELLFVRGITPELFFGGLDSMVTVYADETDTGTTSKININSASLDMLLSLPLMTEELANAVIEYRAENDFKNVSEFKEIVGSEVYSAVSSYITLTTSKYYSLESLGSVDGSTTIAMIEATIHLDSKNEKGFSILEWKDGRY